MSATKPMGMSPLLWRTFKKVFGSLPEVKKNPPRRPFTICQEPVPPVIDVEFEKIKTPTGKTLSVAYIPSGNSHNRDFIRDNLRKKNTI